jgi:RecA-family ATPase
MERSDNFLETLEADASTLLKPEGVFSASELLSRRTEEIPCLAYPIFPKVGIVAVAGSSDVGKSSILRQFAISVVLGDGDFLGFRLKAEHRRAIYVSTEDDEYAISFLLNKANTDRQLSPERFAGLSFIFETENLLQRLQSQLSQHPADVVIIDCFSDLYGRSMNDSNQVRTFLNDYSQLAQHYKCLVIFLHHTGKKTDDLLPSKHNLLGSQGFEAKMRLVIELRADRIMQEIRHFCIVKGNYLPRQYKTESFALRFDDNLQFTDTGERKPFGELIDNRQELKEQVKALKESGISQKGIAQKLGISEATVSRYLRNE